MIYFLPCKHNKSFEINLLSYDFLKINKHLLFTILK